jgi:hypothetical protein
MGQVSKIKLLKQKKTPMKIFLKTFREEGWVMLVAEAEKVLVWDGETVPETIFKITIMRGQTDLSLFLVHLL